MFFIIIIVIIIIIIIVMIIKHRSRLPASQVDFLYHYASVAGATASWPGQQPWQHSILYYNYTITITITITIAITITRL